MMRPAPLPVLRFAVPPAIAHARLVLPRGEGLDLLAWLGLGRPEFGAMSGRRLAPLCRRRLWPLARNTDPAAPGRPPGTLRARTVELLALAEEAGHLPVMFG